MKFLISNFPRKSISPSSISILGSILPPWTRICIIKGLAVDYGLWRKRRRRSRWWWWWWWGAVDRIWTMLRVYIRIIFVSHIKPIMCLPAQQKEGGIGIEWEWFWVGGIQRVLLLCRFSASAVRIRRHPLLSVGVVITISNCYVPTVNC